MTKQRMPQLKDPQDLLLKVIDNTFRRLYGSVAVSFIYKEMERLCGLKREDIPNRLRKFSRCLRKIFSHEAIVIECIIIEELVTRLEFDYSFMREPIFADAIKDIFKEYGKTHKVNKNSS